MTPAEVLAVIEWASGFVEARAEDCYDLNRARAAVAALVAEHENVSALCDRQADLLTGVVNAIKGKPPELVAWSHSDAPELAEKVVAERDRARERIGELSLAVSAMEKERDALRSALQDLYDIAGRDDADRAPMLLAVAFDNARAALTGAGHE